MYKRILVALSNEPSDEPLIARVAQLAKVLGSELLLVHVADGFAARNFQQLSLAESEEMKKDRAYLKSVCDRIEAQGLHVDAQLALGNPPDEIVRVAEENHCDLIAMAAHGHRFLADIVLGSTIEPVRHKTRLDVLVVKPAT